jgi:hypothetical protein
MGHAPEVPRPEIREAVRRECQSVVPGRARTMVGWKVAGNLIQLIREPQEDGALTDVFLLHSDLSNWGYPDK